MSYSPESQKKYGNKCKTYAIKYTPAEIADSNRLQQYLAKTGQSANAYIKALIRADLDAKNIPYPDTEQAEEE